MESIVLSDIIWFSFDQLLFLSTTDMRLKEVILNNEVCREINVMLLLPKCRVSAVGIATGYELDDQGVGVRVPVG
jgi:hypothetical protein